MSMDVKKTGDWDRVCEAFKQLSINFSKATDAEPSELSRALSEAFNSLLITVEELYESLQELIYTLTATSEVTPVQKYSAKKKKNWIFHEKPKTYRIDRAACRHQPYTRRIF